MLQPSRQNQDGQTNRTTQQKVCYSSPALFIKRCLCLLFISNFLILIFLSLVHTDEKAHGVRILIFCALSALSICGHFFLLAPWHLQFWCLDGYVYTFLRNGWDKFWQYRNGFWNDWLYGHVQYEHWYDRIINVRYELWHDWIVKYKPDNVGIIRDESRGFFAAVSLCGIVCGKSN